VPKRDNWTSLLDTEINLPEKNIAVFGFEDTQGKPYFLSFHVTGIGGVLGGVVGGVVGGVLGGIEGGVKGGVEGGVAGGVASEEELAEFAKGAVKAEGHFAPPKLVKFVEPVYPEIARVAQVEGVVVLSARTDINGRVENIKVLRSVPLLDQAAIDAVRQWVYEPGLVKGKPMPFVFTLTVQFRLDGQKGKGKVQTSAMSGIVTEKSDEEFAKGAVKCEGEIKPPQLLKRVEPVYPLDAKKAKVEGVVILAVRTDIKGKITAIKVLRAVPALDQAAIDAVGQWIYEPLIVEGQPKPAVFTVTVRFHLIK
jgi:TonB family protein